MQYDDAFALLLTWTTYGSWLPGDPRGHVSPVYRKEGGFQKRQNIPGTPLADSAEPTAEIARYVQRHETTRLTGAQAHVVADALIRAAADRAWRILQAAVMSNLVHVVIRDCPDKASEVRRALKGTSQAILSRAVGGSRRWWTAHGSDRYLHGEDSIKAAIRYVRDQQYSLAVICDGKIVQATSENFD